MIILQELFKRKYGRPPSITTRYKFPPVVPPPDPPQGFMEDDLIDAGSAAAAYFYSLEKVKSTYSGSCIRVRRASDNVEADIGFLSDKTLDVAALSAHCGASAGYVRTWYDQSGNGRNAAETTAANQPLIWNGTEVPKANGRMGIQFAGGGTHQVLTYTGLTLTDISAAVHFSPDGSTDSSGSPWNNVGSTARSGLYFTINHTNNLLSSRTFTENQLDWAVAASGDRNIVTGRVDKTTPAAPVMYSKVFTRANVSDSQLTAVQSTSLNLTTNMNAYSNTHRVGRRGTTSDDYDGLIHAVRVVNGLDFNTTAIEDELKRYWT